VTFEKWVAGLATGRSYVSDGFTHLMDFAATANGTKYEVGQGGSEIRLAKPGKLSFTVSAAALDGKKKAVPVELIVNGRAVARKSLPCDGKPADLTFDADVSGSCWVALRVMPSGHTNPFFVIVDGKPIRASRASAEWCLAGVEQCWQMKRKTYHPSELKQAEADYDHSPQRSTARVCRASPTDGTPRRADRPPSQPHTDRRPVYGNRRCSCVLKVERGSRAGRSARW
jgi:hypothetical protein